MSLYYTFEFSSQQKPQEISDLIKVEADFEEVGETELKLPAVSVSVKAQDAENQEIVFEDYGFRPNLVATFFLHPSFGLDEGEKVMSQAVVTILKDLPNDAALFYNGETVVLRKKGDEIFLREGWEKFLDSALSANKIKYEIQPESAMSEAALQVA